MTPNQHCQHFASSWAREGPAPQPHALLTPTLHWHTLRAPPLPACPLRGQVGGLTEGSEPRRGAGLGRLWDTGPSFTRRASPAAEPCGAGGEGPWSLHLAHKAGRSHSVAQPAQVGPRRPGHLTGTPSPSEGVLALFSDDM